MRVQGDLGVDEIPRGDSLVQSLAKSRGSRHGCLNKRLSLSAVFIYDFKTPNGTQLVRHTSEDHLSRRGGQGCAEDAELTTAAG